MTQKNGSATEWRARIAEEVWESGVTSDKNRLILDLLDERVRYKAALKEIHSWRAFAPREVIDIARDALAGDYQ
jgi:hypothetical protein